VFGVDRIVEHRKAVRVQAEMGAETLALRLLETAEAVAAQGDRQQAVLVALAAAEVAAIDHDVDVERLACLREQGLAAAARNDPEQEAEILRLTHELVTDAAD